MIMPLKGTIGWLKELDSETLEYLRYSVIGVIIADLLGIIWYFQLRKLGMVIFLSSLIFLTIILALERRKNMEEETEEDKEEEETEEDKGFGNLDFGIPDSKEFNKRMDKALGTI